MQKLACLVAAFWSLTALASAPLGSYNIDPQGITISGVSSGAYMAVQMQVAFSKTFNGVGSVAGGTYWCAKGDKDRAQSVCQTEPEQITNADQVAQAKTLAAQGAIDPLSNLAGKPSFMYSSPVDSIIYTGNTDKLVEFLSSFNVQILQQRLIESAHGFPTLDSGGICTIPMSPWILDCAFDTAGAIFGTVYGPLNFRGIFDPTHLYKFNQADFGDASTPLYSDGWIYVPDSCAKGAKCKLHVALHGCEMNPDYIQDKFEVMTGYNEWAETNNIIVLYPQSAKLGDLNPYACWDWFGFTGANYVAKSGTQMAALMAMINRVQGK